MGMFTAVIGSFSSRILTTAEVALAESSQSLLPQAERTPDHLSHVSRRRQLHHLQCTA